MTITWCMFREKWSVKDRIFCHFGPILTLSPPSPPLPLPLTTQKVKILKKWKNRLEILYRWTINDNYMMYGSWDMKCVRQNFLSFWTILCPFTPLTTWKIKILKNWKKHQEISSFYNGVPKIMIICYTVPNIWHITDVTVIFLFGLSFAHLPP